MSITNIIVPSKIKDKRGDFNIKIVSFSFLDGDVIRFPRVCSNVSDFNNGNQFLTDKLLKQGYRYHKIRKTFSKCYHRHSKVIVKYNISLEPLLNGAYRSQWCMVI